jgi:hypothetical protein
MMYAGMPLPYTPRSERVRVRARARAHCQEQRRFVRKGVAVVRE